MATRHVTPRSRSDRVWAHPASARKRKSRLRWVRRAIGLLFLGSIAALLGYLYILQVYAPGLRSEARSLPQRVNSELAVHGATYVPLTSISPDLQHAIVAIEDRRFYYHPGVDPIGMIRALQINVTRDHVDQGGSTLEEQLVKRAVVGDDRAIHQKLRTIALAWAVDQEFSKSQVLEMYLNAAYYGQGAYGAGEAAHVYFGTDAAHLSLPQAAFLAALPQAPSVYGSSPSSDVVVQRWKTVLNDMANSQYVTRAQAAAAQNTPLTFTIGHH